MTARPTGSWRRRLVAAFTQRIPLKLVSIGLAIVLWLAFSAKEPVEQVVDVRFAPELDSTLVLKDPPPPIRALVVGSKQDLLRLYGSPPIIRRPVQADAPDTLVIDLQPRDVQVPEGIDVVEVAPSSITLRFETSTTRSVPVRPVIDVPTPAGFGPLVRVEPARVDVTGPRRAVFRVPFVSTLHAVIPAGDSLPHLVDLDTARLAGIRVKPTQVKVYVRLEPLPPDSTTIPGAGATSAPAPQARRP